MNNSIKFGLPKIAAIQVERMTHRIMVTSTELARAIINCRHNKMGAIVGNSTLYVPKLKCKFVDRAATVEWPDLNGVMVLMTKGEAARTELDRAFPGLRRVGWFGPMISLFDKLPPMYYTGPGSFRGYYVDLKGAYWTIYQKLWLDTCYPRGMGQLSLCPVALATGTNKAVRNAVIGVISGRYVTMLKKDGTMKQVKSRNKYLSPCLWGTIQDILHDIAYLAVRAGARYICTDGYLFPDQSGVDEFIARLELYGFRLHVTRGDIDIKGWGIYKVGNAKETARYRSSSAAIVSQFSNLYHTERNTVTWWSGLR